MNLFNKIKEKRNYKILTQNFKMITGYNAVFTNFSGGLYEMELIRSCIETISLHASKLNPVVSGSKNKHQEIEKMLQYFPNDLMTTQQFLANLVTILKVENNAYIVPVYEDQTAQKIVGILPVSGYSKLISYNNKLFLVYKWNNEEFAIEYEKVGHLKTHLYKNSYFGEGNTCLNPTIELINTQNQGIVEGIKKSANIRFLAKLSNVMIPEKLKEEKSRLERDNLSAENNGGVLLFDNKYAEIKEINSQPFIVDEKQTNLIRNNVFDYFHISECILQNKASEDEWNSFYEGCIEPIALQIGQVLTKMLISKQDINRGTSIVLESSKLQFASNQTKLNVSQQLFDRGILCTNQVMDIWNLPHVENGDKRYIRKEYTEISNLDGGDDDGKGNNIGDSEGNEQKE